MKMFDIYIYIYIYIVFYCSFLNTDDNNLYRKKSDISKVQSKLGKKKFTEDGSNRKKKNHKEDILLS